MGVLEGLGVVVAVAAWWIGATGAAVRRDVVHLDEDRPDGEAYALVALLGRLRDDPVVLGLRCRIARMISAVFLPLGLAAAAARGPLEVITLAVALGWLLGTVPEFTGGGSVARGWGRARSGLGYGIWARLMHPVARLGRPLLRGRLAAASEMETSARVLAESQASRAAGASELGRQELRFLRRLLASKGILAADIATRWEAVRWIPAASSPEDAARIIRESGHSRLPVMANGRLAGLVTVKDLLIQGPEASGRLPLRPIHFARADLTARDLLEELREARVHLAVTVDRLGRHTGIVTMEDALEEIVGELHDEREAP